MRLCKFLLIALFWLLISFTLISNANSVSYQQEELIQSSRFQKLLTDLRCLVCQNQDLLNSQASLAIDMKQRIYELMVSGKTDKEIKDYLAQRYGDFILFDPPMSIKNSVLWIGPAFFLGIGILGVVFWVRRHRELD